ncbi:MAG: SMP-30/gluconolactonase/LRE family protein [Gemmataceae bacterium]
MVFDRAGTMYVADYVGHNVLKIDPPSRKVSVFAHEPRMNQPNDLAIAPDGTLYASDPNWAKGTGQVWKINGAGTVTLVAANMGTTNGIEVSPDGKTLYVNESVQRNIWAFAIAADGTLSGKRLLTKFADHGFDGMRCDVDGNLYVSRYGKGTVAVVSPAGKVLREIAVLGDAPSNLCFGGPDGRTVYVTEVKKQRLVQFRVDRPGLAWQRWQKSATVEDFTAVKPGTLGVTAFRPTKEKSGFVVGGKNATALIRTLPSLAGRSIADLEKTGAPAVTRPRGFSARTSGCSTSWRPTTSSWSRSAG